MNLEIKKKEVSLRHIQQVGEENFRKGFYCCEALMKTIVDEFELDVPEAVIAMSSGMAVGVGKSGCFCGAVNGGVMALGMLFGRTEQDGPTNPKSIKCMELTNELHKWFMDNCGKNSVCCRVLTREYDKGKGEHKPQCIYFTGLCSWKVAEMICREYGIKVTDEEMTPVFKKAPEYK